MIKEEYKNGCRLKEQVKYNIDYDDCQILNLTCANYIYDLVQESSKYETKLEDVKKMLYMIEKLLDTKYNMIFQNIMEIIKNVILVQYQIILLLMKTI